MPVPQADLDRKAVRPAFPDRRARDPDRPCGKAARADAGPAVPMGPSAGALQATGKHGGAKDAGAAVRPMAGAAPSQFGEDGGRAHAPTMEPSGRAAIPTAAHEGVESTIGRKMEAGGMSRPREILENLLGETYGARGRKAD